MAAKQVMGECRSGEFLHNGADFRTNGCLKCNYLEERIQEALWELNSLQSAIKLLYTELNTVHIQNEVNSHSVEAHCESLSPAWRSVKSNFTKTNNQARRPETVRYGEPVKTANRFAPLSNYSDCSPRSDDTVLCGDR
jgi:hypothetical protein